MRKLGEPNIFFARLREDIAKLKDAGAWNI